MRLGAHGTALSGDLCAVEGGAGRYAGLQAVGLRQLALAPNDVDPLHDADLVGALLRIELRQLLVDTCRRDGDRPEQQRGERAANAYHSYPPSGPPGPTHSVPQHKLVG